MDGYKVIREGETAFGEYREIELTGIRDVIDKRLSRCQENLILVSDFDVMEADTLVKTKTWRSLQAELESVKITYLPYFMKAVAYGLQQGEGRGEFFNTTFDHQHYEDERKRLEAQEIGYLVEPYKGLDIPQSIDEVGEQEINTLAEQRILDVREAQRRIKKRYKVHKQYNIGYAFDTPQGLMVFNIKDVASKSLYDIALEIKDQTTAYQEKGQIPSMSFVEGGTFTISNVGPLGGKHASAIPNYPETNILVTGSLEELLTQEGGNLAEELEMVAKKMMYLSITFDHGITDGGPVRRFMDDIKHFLTSKELLSQL